MTIALPPPLASYFTAKNAFDIDAALAAFAPDAHVHDEHADHRGHAAIRAWMAETTRKYRDTATPESVSAEGGDTIVEALVAGDFPGSPARLTFRFTLANGAIAALRIG